MRLTTKIISSILLVAGIAACSSNDEDEKTRIAELPEFESQFDVDVEWSDSVDGVDDYFSRLRPHIGYQKVFTASRDGDAVAFDLLTGDQVWSTDLSDINGERGFFDARSSALLSGGPTTGGKKVYYGSENGKVFALDAESGELAWEADIKGEVIAAPAFDSNLVVVNTASGILKAINASNGEEVWKVEMEVPPLTLRGISEPQIAAGGVIVGASTGNLNVYILETGQAGWVAEVGEATGTTELERVIDVDSKPVVVGDKIYAISSRGNLVSVDIRSGRILWKRQYSSYRSMSVEGSTIYLTDVKGHVYAVDRINGLEKWSQLSLTNRGVTGPVVVGDYVVVGDFEGYLFWINQNTGDFVSQHHVDGSGIFTEPTVSRDDLLIVQSRDGDIQAIKTPKIVSASN